MSKIIDAVMKFKGRRGSNGAVANTLLHRLAQIDGDSSTNLCCQTLSHNILKQRMAFVAQETDAFFAEKNITEVNPVPFDNGAESLVLDCDNDYVLKIRRGSTYQPVESDYMLQPVQSGYSQELDINYDIFPKIEQDTVKTKQVLDFIINAAKDGYIVRNPNKYNFGFIKDQTGQDNKMIMLDYGALQKGNNGLLGNALFAGYACVKALGMPLYQKMPFIHPLWRGFKSNVKYMLDPPKNSALEQYYIYNRPAPRM